MTNVPPHPPPRARWPLTAAEISSMDIVEAIMRTPLDQAVRLAIGRASTCWVDPATGKVDLAGGVFDDQTADRIVNALLARVSTELAGAVVEAKGEDAAKALIPTLAFPTDIHERQQCPETVRIEGHPQPSRCLLLEGHDGDEHQNGNLRWRRDAATGALAAWFDTAVYETVGLGELLRSGVHLTLPHLPAGAAEELARQRARSDPVEIDVGEQVRELEARLIEARADPVPPSTSESYRDPPALPPPVPQSAPEAHA